VGANKSPFSLATSTEPEIGALEKSDISDIINKPLYFDVARRQVLRDSEMYNLKLDGVELTFVSENKDHDGKVHVKLKPAIQKIPIWSKEIIAHLDAQGELYAVSGEFRAGQPVMKLRFVAGYAEEKAKKYLDSRSPDWKVDHSGLVVFSDETKNTDELVYKVTLFNGLKRHFVFVSAVSGDVIHNLSGMPSL